MMECADCRAWRESAHIVTRRVRLTQAQPGPGATPELLMAVRRGLKADSRPEHRFAAARLALLLVALAQIAIAVPALILGTDREAPLHVAHEMGSFDMALAMGFLIVVWQPARARGMHLLVGAAALLLVATAVIDLFAGRTNLSDEAPHLLVVVGWFLMFTLAGWSPTENGQQQARNLTLERRPIMFIDGAAGGSGADGHDLRAAAAPIERRAAEA